MRVLLALGAATLPAAGEPNTGQQCNSYMMEIMKPPALQMYEACIVMKVNSTDMTVAGADVAVKAQCWCEHRVKEVVDEYGCCTDPTYSAMCQLRCDDDCSSQEARTCLQECPAMCLEQDYAFAGCKCEENNCLKHALCITEQAVNHTQQGVLSPTCDDAAWTRSTEIQNYYSCMQKQPMRTNWQRANSQHHCICDAKMKAGLQREGCCGTTWGKVICETECRNETDCSSTEAQQCLNQCRDNCPMVHPNVLTKTCADSCFNETATCARYMTCEPLDQPAFEYKCQDGNAPTANGCCTFKQEMDQGTVWLEGCPALCDIRHHYYLPHGRECQCFGCPATPADVDRKMREAIMAQSMTSGQGTLTNLAQQAGLKHGPTAKMQEVMTERNKALRNLLDAHTGPFDQALEQEIRELNDVWTQKLWDVTNQEKRCQDDPAACEVSQGGRRRRRSRSGPRGEQNKQTVIIAVSVSLGGLVLILISGIALLMMKMKKKPPAGQASPNPGDSNVVVGRPVDHGAGDAGAEAATSGAPVATSKGEGEASNKV